MLRVHIFISIFKKELRWDSTPGSKPNFMEKFCTHYTGMGRLEGAQPLLGCIERALLWHHTIALWTQETISALQYSVNNRGRKNFIA